MKPLPVLCMTLPGTLVMLLVCYSYFPRTDLTFLEKERDGLLALREKSDQRVKNALSDKEEVRVLVEEDVIALNRYSKECNDLYAQADDLEAELAEMKDSQQQVAAVDQPELQIIDAPEDPGSPKTRTTNKSSSLTKRPRKVRTYVWMRSSTPNIMGQLFR